MLAIISPAKSLDFTSPYHKSGFSEPRFLSEASNLAHAAAKLSPARLADIMHISPKLAALNAERFRSFETPFTEDNARPAIHAFNGDVYAGFEVKSLDEPAIRFAQDHLRILSGLYGLLRPLDLIQPYRLEMGTRWAPGRAKDLYQYWGTRIGDMLAMDLAQEGSGVILNLASQEYWKAVAGALPADARVITIDFREEGPKGLRFNSFAAKRARGMMARYLCEHRIEDAEQLKQFDSDGYALSAEGSEGDVWRFVRR